MPYSYKSVVKTTESGGKTTVSYNENAYNSLNHHLEELHYNYARYLMISSSRSDTMPTTLQGTGSTSIQSAGNTAWLMYNLWDLYQTTGDKELLENEIYPIMRKCANFYTQYIYNNERKTTTDTETYPDGYYYTTWAGRSPEQDPTEEGIKYDLQLVAGMYDYTVAAAEALGVDEDKGTYTFVSED